MASQKPTRKRSTTKKGKTRKKTAKKSSKPRSVQRKRATKKGRNLRQAKGWKEIYPKKGKERVDMIHRCGSSCFLLPQELKFPVCRMSRRCTKEQGQGCGGCVIDRRGVIAARFRAKQWGYTEVEKKADRLLDRMDERGQSEIRLSKGQSLQSV